jgi:murein DD-endopeptidase MepM/ murein hydrolase activator NlpD
MANELDELTGPINPAGNWASEPITIGDQTFTNDPNRGWIDRQTKRPADKSLIKLLDSLELKPVEKKLRVKIDKKVEPVTINGQKFVYDGNALAWIDEKTKVKAADSLQKTLNSVVKVAAVSQTADEVEKAFGTIGQIAKTNVKVKTPKLPRGNRARPSKLTASKKPVAQKTNQSKLINPIIANMVSILASIDDTIKQQLEQKKQLDRQNAEQADENKLESNNALANVEKEHATRIKAKNVLLAGAGGLLLMQYFDPIMKLVTDVGEVVYDMAKYTFDAMGTMADWLGWFNGKPSAVTGSDDAAPTAPPPATPPPAAAPAAAPATPPPPKTPDAKPVKDDRGFLRKAFDWVMGNEVDPKTGKYKVNPIDGDATRQQKPKKPVAQPAPERVMPLDVMRETSDQGMRRKPTGKNKGKLTYHTGVDYGPPQPGGPDGTPVYAAAAGKVSFAKFGMPKSGYGGYGNAVVIQHTDGTTQALYGHLSALNVKEGDVVKAGQTIGAMGRTGESTASHLHFQINKAGVKHHKEGLLDTKAWLKGATVGARIPAARDATIASQVSTGVDTTAKAVQKVSDALNPQLTRVTNTASMNAVASAETIRKSAVEKTADEVGAVQPYVPPPAPPPSMPDLNAGKPNYGIKTPPAPEDKKILANYLIYMNLLPVQTTQELML